MYICMEVHPSRPSRKIYYAQGGCMDIMHLSKLARDRDEVPLFAVDAVPSLRRSTHLAFLENRPRSLQ